MWDAAGSNMVMGTDLTVDTSNTATQLFTLTATGQAKLNQPVYAKFKALLDNYIPDELKPEVTEPVEINEEDDFINTIAVPGGPIDQAFQYLKANGKTAAADLTAFKAILKTMWFTKYAKGGGVPHYSGFEHTFVGETGLQGSNVVVKGLHNWYQFHIEQTAGRLTYAPPPKNVVDTTKKPTFINAAFSWKGANKPPGSSFYVGTSPAFEMALYTACFFGEPGDCTCNIDGKAVMIKTINFHNQGMVLTSYPTA
ncbi:hypothetical protein ACROYT_G037210 [Oculina patagonica]